MDYQVAVVVVIEPARDDLRAVVAFINQDSPERALIFRGRLLTGLHHFVYDVITMEGTELVVRVATRAERHALAEGVRLSSELRPRGVPLPKLLGADLDMTQHPFPFRVLERLPGMDLGHVYSTLGLDQKHAIARRQGDRREPRRPRLRRRKSVQQLL